MGTRTCLGSCVRCSKIPVETPNLLTGGFEHPETAVFRGFLVDDVNDRWGGGALLGAVVAACDVTAITCWLVRTNHL